MHIYYILTLLIALSAAFAYINHRYLKMPFVIGLFFLSTIISVLVLSSKVWVIKPYADLKALVEQSNISQFIIQVMLGFLLFAGSLHTNWINVRKHIKQIALFAIGGVILSTAIIGGLFFLLCSALNVQVDFIYCLLFGALISPTDPIAVLGILTKAGVSKKVETIIVGESLFNDGVGVVIFIALREILETGGQHIDFMHFGLLFLQEAVGGSLFGLVGGLVLHKLLRSIDHYETEVLLTIAFVMAGYNICQHFHLSGPLAMVVMGLLVGNYKQDIAMSDRTQEYVHKLWELIDVIMNAVLFILIALVLVVIDFKSKYLLIGTGAVGIMLFARIVSIYLPKWLLPKTTDLTNNEAKMIIWGGLRGGLSVALALSLPVSKTRDILLLATYMIVVFSILVQGLTISKLPEK